MSRIKIKMITIGHMPLGLQLNKVRKWESEIFQVDQAIENYALRCDSDGDDWEFSDDLVCEQLPDLPGYDLTIAVVNVPLQGNWYARRLGNNRVAFTFYEIRNILEHSNIPLENVIYRILYAYSLVFLRSGRTIPDYGAQPGYTHDETRGCLFDMNGIKTDLVASCHKPIVCDECEERLKQNRVSGSIIASAKKEIRKIKKGLYYRIVDSIKKHPIIALLISALAALSIGIASSLIATAVAENFHSIEDKHNNAMHATSA